MSQNFQKILVLCSLSFVLCLLCIQQGHNWGGDYAMYVAQAKYLVQGNLNELAEINHFAMDQSDSPFGPVLYPMGYPAMLAPLYSLFGLNFIVLKIFTSLFFVGSIPLVYQLLRSVAFKEDLAFYATVLFGVNYQLIYMSDSLGSDIPAMFLCFLALYLMLRTRKNNSWLNAILLGLTIFLCYVTRVAGLVLLPSLMVFHLCHYLKTKKFNLIKVALPYFVFIACYLLYGLIFDSFDSKYLVLFDSISLESIGNNIISYGAFLIEFFVSLKFLPKAIGVVFALAFFPIIAIGIKEIISRENLFLFCFCAAMLVLYIVYPFTSIRFIIPLSAFVIYAILNGLNMLFLRFFGNPDLIKWGSMMLIILGLLQSIMVIVVQQKKGTNESINLEMQSIYAYINEEISDDKIFVFHKPRVLRLFTNNNGFYLNDFTSEKLRQADHLLVSKDGTAYPGFKLQKSWEKYKLMKRID